MRARKVLREDADLPKYLKKFAQELFQSKKDKEKKEAEGKVSYAQAEELGFFKSAKYLGRQAYQATEDLGQVIDSGSIWFLQEADDGSKFLMKETDNIGEIIRRSKDYSCKKTMDQKKDKKELSKKEKDVDAVINRVNGLNKKAENEMESEPNHKEDLTKWAQEKFMVYNERMNEYKYDFDWREIEQEGASRGMSDEDIDTVIAKLEDKYMEFQPTNSQEDMLEELKLARTALYEQYEMVKTAQGPSERLQELLVQIQNVESGMQELVTQLEQQRQLLEGGGELTISKYIKDNIKRIAKSFELKRNAGYLADELKDSQRAIADYMSRINPAIERIEEYENMLDDPNESMQLVPEDVRKQLEETVDLYKLENIIEQIESILKQRQMAYASEKEKIKKTAEFINSKKITAEDMSLEYNTPEEAQQALEQYKTQNPGEPGEYIVEQSQDGTGKFKVTKKQASVIMRACRIHKRRLVRTLDKKAGIQNIMCYTPACQFHDKFNEACKLEEIEVGNRECISYIPDVMKGAPKDKIVKSEMEKDVTFDETIEEIDDEIAYTENEIEIAKEKEDDKYLVELENQKKLLVAEKQFFKKTALDVGRINEWVEEVYTYYVNTIKPIIEKVGEQVALTIGKVKSFMNNLARNVEDVAGGGYLDNVVNAIREVFGEHNEDPSFVVNSMLGKIEPTELTASLKSVTAQEEMVQPGADQPQAQAPDQTPDIDTETQPVEQQAPMPGEENRDSQLAQLKSDMWNSSAEDILAIEGDINKIVQDFRNQIIAKVQNSFANNEITEAEYNQLLDEIDELDREGKLEEDMIQRMIERTSQETAENVELQTEEPETKKITEAPPTIEGQPEEAMPLAASDDSPKKVS
jgi:hypothetical protein